MPIPVILKEISDLSSYKILKVLLFLSLYFNYKQYEAKDQLVEKHALEVKTLTETWDYKAKVEREAKEVVMKDFTVFVKDQLQINYNHQRIIDSLKIEIRLKK